MEKAKFILTRFFDTIGTYDYIGFFLSIFLFLLFLIIYLLLRKHIKRSIFLAIIGFSFLFMGPVFSHKLVKNTLYNSEANITTVKQLHYSDTLLIKGVLHYKGIKDASHCLVSADIYKKGKNMVKDFVYNLKAYRKGSHKLDATFSTGTNKNYKIVIEPFAYKGDYNISISSGCYL